MYVPVRQPADCRTCDKYLGNLATQNGSACKLNALAGFGAHKEEYVAPLAPSCLYVNISENYVSVHM